MAIEKCINEYDVGHVIFEEGSTGRELFVVLDGQVEIAKVNGAAKTVMDCKFLKEEDERLTCYNGFVDSMPKMPKSS